MANTKKRSQWRKISLAEAVQVNPPVSLKRGEASRTLNTASVTPGRRYAGAHEEGAFAGGGSRFTGGDTLMAQSPKLAMQVQKTGTSQQARKRCRLTHEGVKRAKRMLNREPEAEQ